MVSVLIQNKKTTESFEQYHPLFMKLLDDNDFCVCKWVESGYTLDSALPELKDIIYSNKEWRAIIVHTDDDYCMSNYERTCENPYDFIASRPKNGESVSDYKKRKARVSEIPLVRLTQLLGGLPALEQDINFEYEVNDTVIQQDELSEDEYNSESIVEEAESQEFNSSEAAANVTIGNAEKYNIKKIVYKIDSTDELKDLYEAEKIKIDEDFKRPSEIVLITLRNGKNYDYYAQRHNFSYSSLYYESDFCHRNRYPDKCRFIVMDYLCEGKAQREADYFKLWSAVRVIADNKLEPSAIRAYKLHRLDLGINIEKLYSILQEKADRMDGIDYYIEEAIKKDKYKKVKDIGKKPELDLVDKIFFNMEDVGRISVDEKKYAFIPKSNHREVASWEQDVEETNREIEKRIKGVKKGLDANAEKIRIQCQYGEKQVKELNVYDEEELREQLQNNFIDIIELQHTLPDSNHETKEELIKKSKEIESLLKNKINVERFSSALFILFVACICALVPSAIIVMLKDGRPEKQLVLLGLGSILILFLTVLIIILKKKIQTVYKISQYNDLLMQIKEEFNMDESKYVDFLSNISTYMQGVSYFNVLNNKRKNEKKYNRIYNRHKIAAEVMREKIRTWAIAFGLDISFDINNYVTFDLQENIVPKHNAAYSLEQEHLDIDFNHSGSYCKTPLQYIDSFDLIREELCEDERFI